MEDSKIVVYRTFQNVYEAHEAKNILEANGVPCFLSNENMSTLYPIFNEDLSGVRLQLFEKDIPIADQILDNFMKG